MQRKEKKMKSRSFCYLTIVFIVFFGFIVNCGNGSENGKVYKTFDGRTQKLELNRHGIKMVYNFDPMEMVQSAFAYSGETLLAKAERVGLRPGASGKMEMEIEIIETHFKKNGEIVYRGKIVFLCRPNIEYGERIKEMMLSGKRPKDLFQRWPYAIRY